MKAYKAVARTLIDNGVDTMFGLIGDANMYFVSEFKELSDHTRYVGAADEGAACLMAHGYARVSGRVGVASITHGPAASNTVTAITEAVRAHSPVLLITGDTPGKRDHIQHIDLQGLFSATGADYWRVLSPEHVVDDIARLLAQVAATNRPVVMDIPFGIHHEEIEYEPARLVSHRKQAVAPDPDMLDEVLGRLASANRPVIVAGRGAVEANAKAALEALADQLGAPLATTASANGLFEGHPYNLGVCGASGKPWAMDIVANADCLGVFGAGLNYYTTAEGNLLSEKSVVQCDVAPGAIGRYSAVSLALIGDARLSAEMMTEQLKEAGVTPSSYRTSKLGDGVLDRSPRQDFVDQSDEHTLDMRTAMITLDELLPKDRIVVTDGGRFITAPWQYLHAQDARKFLHTFAFGSIGLGVPTAIGASVAQPDVPTVAVVGDGGGMMGLIEFWTAVREDLPFILVVLNDGAYGAEYAKLDRAGYGGSASFVQWPEFADVGRALGGQGVTVRSEQELRDVIGGIDLNGQTVIDIKADPHVAIGEI